jgi:hypothetical protein
VRMVEIHEVEAIPPYIEFAGKTMKLKDNLEHRKSRSTEALACLVDHPGVIKVMYLDRRTYESFTLWWNGGPSLPCAIMIGSTNMINMKVNFFVAQAQIMKHRRDWCYIERNVHTWLGH